MVFLGTSCPGVPTGPGSPGLRGGSVEVACGGGLGLAIALQAPPAGAGSASGRLSAGWASGWLAFFQAFGLDFGLIWLDLA